MLRFSTTLAALALTAIDVASSRAAENIQQGPQQRPQQLRMAACNKEAVDLKGDERKSFMSRCLADKKLTQQEKMKDCNAQAGERRGDERKAFMSTCSSN